MPVDIQILDKESDGPITVAIVRTSVGALKVMADVSFDDGCLILDRLHLHGIGLRANALGSGRLRQIIREVLDELEVEAILIRGSRRTTGANPGRRPKPIRITRFRATQRRTV